MARNQNRKAENLPLHQQPESQGVVSSTAIALLWLLLSSEMGTVKSNVQECWANRASGCQLLGWRAESQDPELPRQLGYGRGLGKQPLKLFMKFACTKT